MVSTRAPSREYLPDTGCPGGCKRSLECHLAVCIYDETPQGGPGRGQTWDRRHPSVVERRQRARALHADGALIGDIAAELRVSKRTIFRLLAQS